MGEERETGRSDNGVKRTYAVEISSGTSVIMTIRENLENYVVIEAWHSFCRNELEEKDEKSGERVKQHVGLRKCSR